MCFFYQLRCNKFRNEEMIIPIFNKSNMDECNENKHLSGGEVKLENR